jgi:hypothetical protein
MVFRVLAVQIRQTNKVQINQKKNKIKNKWSLMCIKKNTINKINNKEIQDKKIKKWDKFMSV